jgi:hypothetical protein
LNTTAIQRFLADTSLSQKFLLLVGLFMLASGIAGFAINSDFSSGETLKSGHLFGFFDVNGWHNLSIVISGVAALAAALTVRTAFVFLPMFAAVNLATAVWALFDSSVFWILPIEGPDDIALHVFITAQCIAVALAEMKFGRDALVPTVWKRRDAVVG